MYHTYRLFPLKHLSYPSYLICKACFPLRLQWSFIKVTSSLSSWVETLLDFNFVLQHLLAFPLYLVSSPNTNYWHHQGNSLILQSPLREVLVFPDVLLPMVFAMLELVEIPPSGGDV